MQGQSKDRTKKTSGTEPDKLRNLNTIRREIRKELDSGFKYTDRKIDSLHSGVGSIFVPFIKLAYNFGARDQIRVRGLAQLDLLVNCASECDGYNLCKLVDDHFDDYLFYDETFMRSRQSHPSMPYLKNLLREIFLSRLQVMHMIACGNGTTYEELVRSIMNKNEAQKLLGRDLEYVGKVIKLIAKEKDLLDIPSIGRNEVVKMLNISYSYAKNRIEERVNEIFCVA